MHQPIRLKCIKYSFSINSNEMQLKCTLKCSFTACLFVSFRCSHSPFKALTASTLALYAHRQSIGWLIFHLDRYKDIAISTSFYRFIYTMNQNNLISLALYSAHSLCLHLKAKWQHPPLTSYTIHFNAQNHYFRLHPTAIYTHIVCIIY